jgi:hypothetical protein
MITVLPNDRTSSSVSSSLTPSWLGGRESEQGTRGRWSTLARATILFVLAFGLLSADCGLRERQILGVPGEDLNYEETVVYNNDAIRPAFLIVYGDAPPVPPKPIATRAAVRKLFTTPLVS